MNPVLIVVITVLVVWIFMLLWILGTSWKEGLWGNALVFINWCLAALFAFKVGILLAELCAGLSKDDGVRGLIFFVVFFVVYLAAFAGLRWATDSLSRVKVAFHPVVNVVGSLFFCFLNFIGLSGLFVFGVALAAVISGGNPWWLRL